MGENEKQVRDTDATQVTIRDVARCAGVSPSTVSRAFARPGRVSAQTAERVYEAADRLGYRSQSLEVLPTRGGRKLNGLLAIAVADLGNPIYADHVKSAQRESLSKGFGLLVVDSEETNMIERQVLNLALSHVDGIILASSRLSDASIRKLAQVKPLIALNRAVRGVRSIVPDMQQGMGEVVDYLLELQHREITYLAGPEASWQEGRRWRLLSMICENNRMKLRRIACKNPDYRGGFIACEEFIRCPTTAVFAYNDIVAIGFIRALQSKGIEVPHQVSVVGVDDAPVGQLVTPSLSTIHFPRREPARQAVSEIIAHVHSMGLDKKSPTVSFLKTHFIPRESTALAASKSVDA